jgi:hypothetical protein
MTDTTTAAERREMMVSRTRRLALWAAGLCVLAMTPVDLARAQNLDAGKPASQIFAEVCANCHKSPREVRNNPSTSFLREHYTTGSEMASSMAAYLTALGGDSRAPNAPNAGQPRPKAPPAPVGAAAPGAAATVAREVPPARAQTPPEPKPSAPVAPQSRIRPGAAAVTEAKPSPTAGTPARPVLEDFEE